MSETLQSRPIPFEKRCLYGLVFSTNNESGACHNPSEVVKLWFKSAMDLETFEKALSKAVNLDQEGVSVDIPRPFKSGDYVRAKVVPDRQGDLWVNAVARVESIEDDGPVQCKLIHEPRAAVAHIWPEELEMVRSYLSLFVKGQRFRVVEPGARISGFKPSGPYTQTGFSLALEVGTIITCAGRSMTMGDGVPAIKWRNENGEWICNDAIFAPYQGGMWGGLLPALGYLEPLDVSELAPQAKGGGAE